MPTNNYFLIKTNDPDNQTVTENNSITPVNFYDCFLYSTNEAPLSMIPCEVPKLCGFNINRTSRVCVPPIKYFETTDLNLIIGQGVDQIEFWKNINNFGEMVIWSISGQPHGIWVDNCGVLRGKVEHTNTELEYNVIVTATTKCGTVDFNFIINLDTEDEYQFLELKTGGLVTKEPNFNTNIFTGYENNINGLGSNFNQYGEIIGPSTFGQTNQYEVVGFNICAASNSKTSIPDKTNNQDEYIMSLYLKGNWTQDRPFNSISTGNRKYDYDKIDYIDHNPITNSTRYSWRLSGRFIENLLPCWYFDINLSLSFPSLCDIINDKLGINELSGNIDAGLKLREKVDTIAGISANIKLGII